MSDYVSVAKQGTIAIITLNNPPVNALSHHLRAPLDSALKDLRDDGNIDAVIITCAGRTFVAGADITEFGKPMQAPSLRDLIATLESFKKPTIASIHGTALGGGLELALGCHFRLATRNAKLGLPEVKLGILPGAGGTQRLPRLTGPETALDMICTGKLVDAERALATGIIDRITENDLVNESIAFARQAIAENLPLVQIRDRDDRLLETRANPQEFDKRADEIRKKARGLDAPVACADSVRNSFTLPFAEGLEQERAYFEKLVAGDQSRAQRYLFFAQRDAAKVAGVDKTHKPRNITNVGIIGAGTMGGGIAMAFVNGGIPVKLLEMNEDAIARGLATIGKNYDISVSRGSLSVEEKAARMKQFSGTTDFQDLADCDLIIEAVFEDIEVKRDVFSKLDQIAKPGAILATNTSYLDVNKIAQFTRRPTDVIGLHFFSPANVMKLLEIVRGEATAPEVIATALDVARRIGKIPVVAGVCHGFIGNRMLGARSAENENLLLEGASPEDVDRAFTDFGWPMGPFQMGDLAGLDIGWRNRKALGKKAAIADALCEEGRFGQKTGKGYYLYETGSRKALPDPFVDGLIRQKAEELGLKRREISQDEILERTMYPMINEGAKILEEGIAARPSDIDIVWVNGYGFPVAKGGPMFWADSIGLGRIVERLEFWHERTGNAVFKPSSLLERLEGKGFSSLKTDKA